VSQERLRSLCTKGEGEGGDVFQWGGSRSVLKHGNVDNGAHPKAPVSLPDRKVDSRKRKLVARKVLRLALLGRLSMQHCHM